jgi:uncharacterized protein YndB with AHSA1/START domain
MRLIALALALLAPAAAQAQTVTIEADGSRTLMVEAFVRAPPAAVWSEITTAEGWMRWAVPTAWLSGDVLETAYAPNAKPGAPINIRQRFVAMQPNRRLVFRTIQVPEGFPHGEAFMGVTSTLELIPEGKGTRVRLTGANYPAGQAGDELLGFFKTGNQQTIDHLAARFALKPLDFLAGHCWRGTLPNGDVDTHCFKHGGGKVTDHHEVVRAGTKVYFGDTTYAPEGGVIGWTYVDMAQGVMKGIVAQTEDGLDFGTSTFVPRDGAKVTMATRWVRIGALAYDARDTSTDPRFTRTTRYTRIN